MQTPASRQSQRGEETRPVVHTANGSVAGTTGPSGIHRFAGIPYAAAPVGRHRFRAPQPPGPYGTADAPLDAALFGPPPPQFDADPAGFAPHRAGDDWLTVNVWTPRLPRTTQGADSAALGAASPVIPDGAPVAGLPVMVWIYGGSYVNGCSADPEYDGTAFARDGVVFVSLNYRLGVEGFAHFPDAPANRGLLDQVAALAWVRDNIAAFGGDPDNVTVFGESAGGGSVHALLTMPAATGLFRRAIAQSPPAMVLGDDLAGEVAAEFARVAGEVHGTADASDADGAGAAGDAGGVGYAVDADGTSEAGGTALEATAASFATVDPHDWPAIMARVVAGQMRLAKRWGRAVSFMPPLCPVVDGTVLPADPWEAVRAGAGSGVDLIVGTTAAEFLLFMAYNPQEIDQRKTAHRVQLMGPDGGAEAYSALMADATPEEVLERVQSDRVFTTAALDLAAGHAAAGGAGVGHAGAAASAAEGSAAEDSAAKTYVYVFDGAGRGGIGAAHTAELAPLFDVFDGDHGALAYPHAGPADHKLGALMRRAWVAFAASGDPNVTGDDLPPWTEWAATGPGAVGPQGGSPGPLATRVWKTHPATEPHPFAHRWAAFARDPARPLHLEG